MEADESPQHVDQASEFAESSAEFQRMERVLSLFESGVDLIPALTWEHTDANVYAASACLTMAARQLRASSHLAFIGYYGESRVQLRATYEFAGLARVLAKDPQLAERWLQKQEWFPDRKVRAWIQDAQGAPEETMKAFRAHYARASAWSHPTAVSTASVVELTNDGPMMMRAPQFDADRLTAIWGEVAFTALFACFTLRNAAVDESAIDPEWRKALYVLAREVSGDDLPHLERDWQRESDIFESVRRRAARVADLDERLRSAPNSWQNLRASDDPVDDSEPSE